MQSDPYKTFLDLQRYVGWSVDDARLIATVRDVLISHEDLLVEDFFAEVSRHPHTAEVIARASADIADLKLKMRQWLRQLLTGPYDRDYVVQRNRVGYRHVAINLDQVYTNGALSRLRMTMLGILRDRFHDDLDAIQPAVVSLNKLLDLELAIIENAYQTEFIARQTSLGKENLQLRTVLERNQPPVEIVGFCEAMQEIYRLIERTGPTDKPILIEGESGTGKELVAQALHRASHLADKPMVVVNCAALSETLLESELFGHEKGAFTGAVSCKTGLFEVADGGTLFIDEIGELAGGLQAKLLRVLENGTLRRVGSVRERRVKVRLLAATNRDLAEEVAAGRFREDLYYRINVLAIRLPPLRERAGDIPHLLQHFAGDEWRSSDDLLAALEIYSWPGNVRQFRNAIERAKVLAEDDELLPQNLPPEIVQGSSDSLRCSAEGNSDLESINRCHIAQTYHRYGGNKTRTARALGISRRTLYRLLVKYSIDDEEAV